MQYCRIAERPLVYYTLETLEKIPWVTCIVVPVASEYVPVLTHAAAAEWGFSKTVFIAGGDTRHRSIHEGIKHILALQTAQTGSLSVSAHTLLIRPSVLT